MRRFWQIWIGKRKIKSAEKFVEMGRSRAAPLQGRGSDLQRQEIFQELLAGFGEDGLGVELDAFEFVTAVADAHDNAVVGFRGDG